jgi:hypothetical protein
VKTFSHNQGQLRSFPLAAANVRFCQERMFTATKADVARFERLACSCREIRGKAESKFRSIGERFKDGRALGDDDIDDPLAFLIRHGLAGSTHAHQCHRVQSKEY